MSAFDRYFRDDVDRRWELFISRSTYERIIETCYFAPPTMESISQTGGMDRLAELFDSLLSDRRKIEECLLVVVARQLEQRGVTKAEFLSALQESYGDAERGLFRAFAELNRGNVLGVEIMPLYERMLRIKLEKECG